MPQRHVLQPNEDPENLCGPISDEWIISNRLTIGRKADGNRYVHCSPLIISNGDFIDIAVEFDIASTRNANGVYVNRVHLSMQHVIQLVTVDNVRTVSTTMAR